MVSFYYRTQSSPFDADVDKVTFEEDGSTADSSSMLLICDKVGNSYKNAYDCFRSIVRGLDNPKPHVVLKTITLLEFCVKNCKKAFLQQISSANFEHVYRTILQKAITQKQHKVADRLKSLLKGWADNEFKSDPEFNLIPAIYYRLKQEGIDFSHTPEDSLKDSTSQLKDPNAEASQQKVDIARDGVTNGPPIDGRSIQLRNNLPDSEPIRKNFGPPIDGGFIQLQNNLPDLETIRKNLKRMQNYHMQSWGKIKLPTCAKEDELLKNLEPRLIALQKQSCGRNKLPTGAKEDERLKNLEPHLIAIIRNEIMYHDNPVTWDDIFGLEFAKRTIQEIVVWPLLRPDIFTGLRRPSKGILLFGPPGTGKTLIGKCIASQSNSTFFSISASSISSKWIGESEKLVRTLFAVARCHQPAVIFIDEIDSLLRRRSEIEHESYRRVKTEFLVQLDGATTCEDDRILVIGATNRPQELDDAVLRRLVKRLYIPLPEFEARRQLVQHLMSTEKNDLSQENLEEIAKLTEGYSGADVKNLCKEASFGPIRSIDFQQISSIKSEEVRPATFSDFEAALKVVRPSVSSANLNQCLEWDKVYGSRGA